MLFSSGEAEEDEQAAYTPQLSGSVRDRSAFISTDPKMKELKRSQRPGQASSSAGPRGDRALRSEGCEAVDRFMKRLAAEKAAPPRYGGACAQLPECFREDRDRFETRPSAEAQGSDKRRYDPSETRQQWRGRMDHMLKRLMTDMELARDERLRNYTHQAQCDHLDKVYDWYTSQGSSASKKKSGAPNAAPPFVRYSPGSSVMAGSMRNGLSSSRTGTPHSASSPSLLGGGALGLDSAASTPTATNKPRLT